MLRYHNHGLDREPSVAVIEQILQGGSEKIDDQNIVEALLAEVVDIRDAGCLVSVL